MTEEQARYLIELMKKLVSNNNVYLPQPGDEILLDIESTEEYKHFFKVKLFRGKREPDKCSFHAMEAQTMEPLLRIDVGGPEHTNPDGTRISGNHMHLFKDGYELKYACEFDVTNKDLVKIALEFFEEFNVLNPKPTVFWQTT